MTMISTPEGIQFVRLCSLRGRMALELKGIRFRGPAIAPVLRREFGWKGSKQAIYTQLCEHIEKLKGEK